MRQMGGMIAFELHGGLEAGVCFMDALQLVTRAVSLGDAETLAQHPASMTHSTYTPKNAPRTALRKAWCACRWGLEDVGPAGRHWPGAGPGPCNGAQERAESAGSGRAVL